MNSIPKFNQDSFIEALKGFFIELQVPVNYLSDKPTGPQAILAHHYKAHLEAHQLIQDVYALGMVDNAIFQGTNTFKNLGQIQDLNADYDGLLLLGIILDSRKNGLPITRSHLAEITRAFNRTFPYTPVTIIFKYGNFISFANSERIKYKQEWREGEKVDKVSLIFNINTSNIHEGHRRILLSLSADKIRERDKKNKVNSYRELNRGWAQVFTTSVLGKQFYLDYSKLSVKLIKQIHPKQVKNKLIAHQGILNLLNRIMFIYFVQKKEWIMKDENFIIHFYQDYLASGKKNSFHEDWLNSIFFSAFNGIAYKSPKAIKALPEPYKSEIINFPYLNGGLFAYNDDYDNFLLDDKLFEDIFGFFESYIFTISEDTPYDVNLEINPELLGKMYEGMINATDLDDVDAENGIIYTERPEINFMTRRSFVEVLDKKLNGSLSREFLYHFIFDEPEQKRDLLSHYKTNIKNIRSAVQSVTICDPACGSGSMLLGAIQLQMELLRVLDEFDKKPHSPKDDFLIKKQLISECIHGVDIKEWAVKIAELRLWLYMIAEAEFTKEELTKTPLLPNLDFKLRKGNSLLQKFGSLDFTLEELLKGRNKSAGAARKLNEFVKKKKEFILNQEESKTTYKKLKAEEFSVFNQFIDELIIECDQKLKNLNKKPKQEKLFDEPEQVEIDVYAEEKERLHNEIEQLKKLKATIHKEKKLPFSYDIDFMEVFLTNDDAGFDLIIGNPPYVRQEQILPPEDGEYLEHLLLPKNKDEKARVNKEYKEELNAKVYKTFPFLSTTVKTQIDGKNKTIPVYGSKVPGRSDLYCYFQLLCPEYLNSKGTFCFIISNSWLDVDFGSFVQQFLLKHTDLPVIYDCNVRSFDASINTIIYLHSTIRNNCETRESYYKTLKPNDNTVQFVMNKIDYTNAAYAPLLLEQEHCRKNTFNKLYRVITLTQKELYEAGYDEEQVQYTGDKWGGKYLRAPEIYYTVLQKGKNKFEKLSDIANVRRGFTTGANEFFFLPNKFFNIKEGSSTYKLIPKQDELPTGLEIEKEFLFDAIISLKDVKNIDEVFPELSLKILLTKGRSINGKKLKKYIEWGEESEIVDGKELRAYNKRTTCASRSSWFNIQLQEMPQEFYSILNGDRHLIFFNNEKYFIGDNMGNIRYTSVKDLKNNIAFHNSTTFRLFMEMTGREMTGALTGKKIQVYEFAALPALKIEKSLSRKKCDSSKEIVSILTELGFNRNEAIREQQPNPLPDRKELDDIIFNELGLTQEERNEVYWSVAELVKQRLDKAASR